MKRIKVQMNRKNLNNIPVYSLSQDYSIRYFQEGDHLNWAYIVTKAGEFENINLALNRFEKEFNNEYNELNKRCLFLLDKFENTIGTITAWYGENSNEIQGRIHFLSLLPEYQNKKLSKPLLTKALQILSIFHDKAYLTSQTTSYKAINMYLNYGFEQTLYNNSCKDTWNLLEYKLNRKIL